MRKKVFGFLLGSDKNYEFQNLDSSGKSLKSWTLVLAEKAGIEPPLDSASDQEVLEYEKKVIESVIEHGCRIIKLRNGRKYEFYVSTLFCKFAENSLISREDQFCIYNIVRNDLCKTVREFCEFMNIEWREPEFLSVYGTELSE